MKFHFFIEFINCTDDNGCDENAVCNNITGTPVCTCNEGFVGTGRVCEGSYVCTVLPVLFLAPKNYTERTGSFAFNFPFNARQTPT